MSLLGKVNESADGIMKNWLYRLILMSKHCCCQSKKLFFELFNLCTVISKFLPYTYKVVCSRYSLQIVGMNVLVKI